ncbi:MAG: hypothetical protein NXI20_19295 [bacterium]|nr:hypothetical protein [bacterium]
MEILGYHIIIIGILVYLIHVFGKVRMNAIVKEGFPTVGTIIGYEQKMERVAGSWTTLEYPIVEYYDAQNRLQTGFIKYAKSSGRYFQIDDEVEIVVHDNTIYYRHAFSSSKHIWIAGVLILVGIVKEIYDLL